MSDLRVFFTPWGEALTRRWYWQAFEALSELPFVSKVAVQTNLSCRLDWIKNCNREKLGIWATYHPSQVALGRFVNQINKLVELGVSHSVGMVGVKEDFDSIQELRCRLPSTTYLWINALKRTSDYYSSADVEFLSKIDPMFAINNTRHASMGRECATGHHVVSVAGDGEIRRCHFVPDRLGNLYTDDLGQILRPRVCPNATCGCHIGYAHLQPLKLVEVFGPGLLERIPLSHQRSFSDHQNLERIL